MNDRLEIEGDMREEVNAEHERIEGYEACPIEPETDEDVETYAEDYALRLKYHIPSIACEGCGREIDPEEAYRGCCSFSCYCSWSCIDRIDG